METPRHHSRSRPPNSQLCRSLKFVCLSKMDANTVDRSGYAKVPVR